MHTIGSASSSSMSKSIAVPKTCALKLKICCIDCEKKFKKSMLKIYGVEQIEVDRKKEQVTISGTLKPQTIINKLREYGIEAELLWEKSPKEKNETSLQIVQSEPIQAIQDRNVVEQLQELAGIEGLEEVQVTYTTNMKLIFKDKIVELSKEDGTCSEKIVMDVHRRGRNDVETHSKCCCGHVMNGSNHGGCDHRRGPPWFCPDQYNQNSYGAYEHRPPPACTCSAPPPWPQPTAPPEQVDYQYKQEQANYEYNRYNRYHSPFSDENPNSCTVM